MVRCTWKGRGWLLPPDAAASPTLPAPPLPLLLFAPSRTVAAAPNYDSEVRGAFRVAEQGQEVARQACRVEVAVQGAGFFFFFSSWLWVLDLQLQLQHAPRRRLPLGSHCTALPGPVRHCVHPRQAGLYVTAGSRGTPTDTTTALRRSGIGVPNRWPFAFPLHLRFHLHFPRDDAMLTASGPRPSAPHRAAQDTAK